MPKTIHVTPHKNGGHQVIQSGNKKASYVTRTQNEAIEKGKNLAKKNKTELLIHGENGQIREKRSYGNDPFPPKDKK